MSMLRELRARFTATSDGFRNVTSQMRDNLQDVGEAGEDGANRADTSFTRLRNTLLGFAGAYIGFEAIKGAVGGVFSASNDLQEALNQLQTKTGATDAEMVEFGDSLQNIYKNNFGDSFMDIAEAMSEVKNVTGLTGKELESTTETAFLMRDTFGYEVTESVKAADTMMKTFGISSDEAYTLIAQGAQQGADKGGELLDTLNEYSPQFKAIGFDAEYMMDTLISGAENGSFSIDKIGDAVKEMNIRMKDGNEETGDALTSLGLNADKTREAFAKGGTAGREAFEDVMQALVAVEDPMEKNTMGVALFGSQFEDLEAEAIEALAGVDYRTNMTGDTLQKMNEIKYNTVGEAITGMGRQFMMGVVVPVQQKVMPAIMEFLNSLPNMETVAQNVMSAVGGYIQKLKPAFDNLKQTWLNLKPAFEMVGAGIALAIGAIVIAIPPILEAITWVAEKITAWEGFIPVIGGIVAGLVTFKTIMFAITTAKKAWLAITTAVRGAMILLNTTMLMNPIVLIIALIVGLVAAIVIAYQKSETFRGIIDGLWKALKDGFAAVISWFTTTLPAWIASVGQWFQTLWTNIMTVLSGLWTSITTIWNNIWTSIMTVVTAIVTWVVNAWNTLKTGVSNAITAVKDTAVSIWTALSTRVIAVVTTLKDMAISIFNFLKDGVMTAISNLATNVMTIIQPFITFFIQSFENLKLMVLGIISIFIGIFTGDMEALKLGVLAIIEAFKRQFHNIIQTLVDVVMAIVTLLVNGWTKLFNTLKNALIKAGTAIKDGVVKAVTALKDGTLKLMTSLKEGAINAWNALKTGVVNAVNALKTGAINTINNLKSGAINTFNALKTGAINAWNALKTGAVNALNNLKSSASNAVSNIKNGIVNGFQSAKQSAVDKFNQMKTAISNAFSTIKNYVSTFKSNIISKFKSINLRQIGKDIISGLYNGIKSMASTVMNKAKDIANGIKNTIKDALKINSPSRVLMDVGMGVGEGLTEGMQDQLPSVEKMSGKMAEKTIDPIAKAKMPKLNINPDGIKGMLGSAVNLTLNYHGNNKDDAYDMLNMIEKGLNDRLGNTMRFGGVKR